MAPSLCSASAAALSVLLLTRCCAGAAVPADVCTPEGICPEKGHQMLATRIKSKVLEVTEQAREDSLGGLTGTHKAGDLNKMALMLQKLATGVVEGKETVSDTQKEVLKSIADQMDAIISAILASHQEDQGEVDRSKATAAACSVPAEELEASRQDTGGKETGHSTCRVAESAAKAQKTAACNLYHSIATNQNMP
eukprot:CAMPEP_0171239908 /NCGR_PEP_ID=MMETSP0790-20130122/44214_1 /TAXON_ID=2925 /ORGANISM="Alexandrium catenella, Strain OF101" /LENGTH=194 /DNA_ID=CAMNT_0011706285 /DNA_START=76 /DNA_END=657 /DNA_ORIENTATION=-